MTCSEPMSQIRIACNESELTSGIPSLTNFLIYKQTVQLGKRSRRRGQESGSFFLNRHTGIWLEGSRCALKLFWEYKIRLKIHCFFPYDDLTFEKGVVRSNIS